jgi:hypothetical protein
VKLERNHEREEVCLTIFTLVRENFLQGPVVQSLVSANPGLNFNLLFLFMYFCMIIRLKTLENKTSIEPEKISRKTYST